MLALLTEIRRYVWAYAPWLDGLRRVWIALFILIAVISIASLLPGRPDDQLRYAGLALQLLGVGTVAYLLRDKRKTFDRKGMLTLLIEWVRARPRFRPKAVILQGSPAVSHATSCEGRLSIWKKACAAASVEQRINVLEANLESLRADHTDTAARMYKMHGQLADNLAAERQQRERTDRETAEKLEKLGAEEGLHLEATGLVWLIFGIILATIPTELVELARIIGLIP